MWVVPDWDSAKVRGADWSLLLRLLAAEEPTRRATARIDENFFIYDGDLVFLRN